MSTRKQLLQDKIQQKKMYEIFTTHMIEDIFSTYILMDLLLSNIIISKIKHYYKKIRNTAKKEGLFQGYKLLLVAILDNYIDCIVRNPEMIGVTPDSDYYDYWAFTKGRGREITRSAVRSKHYISEFVEKTNSIIKELISLKNWNDLTQFALNIESFIGGIKNISEKGYIAYRNERQISMSNALTEASKDRLWSIVGNPTPIAHLYSNYFTQQKKNEISIKEFEEFANEFEYYLQVTRIDHSQVKELDIPRPLPFAWSLGYIFAFHEGLKHFVNDPLQTHRLNELDSYVKNTKSWFNIREYSNQVLDFDIIPKGGSRYVYKKKFKISKLDRMPLTKEVKITNPPERLLSIFGNRARIVESENPAAESNFECLLDGTIKKHKKTNGKVKIAIIEHKINETRKSYSVAILMPARSLLSNASMWWVFYLIGDNYSNEAAGVMHKIYKKIKQNMKYLDIIKDEAQLNEFYDFCEDPGYNRLRKIIVKNNQIFSEIRGILPELLISVRFSEQTGRPFGVKQATVSEEIGHP